MIIKGLEVHNFRNYDHQKLSFAPGLNLICGENAQGKTNLLEAIYLVGTGKSFRTPQDRDLINVGSGASAYQVQVQVESKWGDLILKVEYDKKSGKTITLNHTLLAKRSELLGYLTVVIFTPEDLNIVKGGPSHRRRFIDLELAQINPGFRSNLIDYSKVLGQRNNLLKQVQNGANPTLKEVFDVQLTELAIRLTAKRIEALHRITAYARAIHQAITKDREELALEYVSSYPAWGGQRTRILDGSWQVDQNEQREVLLKYFKAKEKEEIQRGATGYGPHRDDLNLLVNGRDVRTFGSQGQQRTAALALKLAELEFMKEQTGEYPVLLLDDVLSELDKTRRKYLMDVVKDQVQVIVTSTELDFFDLDQLKAAKVFKVANGKVNQL
ncbi:MAG: DNA replication/repair protein RecF [Firmicutes bacterium]|nr:DNA replication/repair protein RecF [Bacillota bacterium]